MEGAAITINNVNINIGALLITPFVFAVAFYVFNRWIIKGLFSSSPQSPVHDASLEVEKNSHSRRDRIVEQIISGTISAILAGIFLSYFGIGSPPSDDSQTSSTAQQWSEWSEWTTDEITSSSEQEVQTRQKRVLIGYNMVHYGTQQDTSPYYRMFRDYSIDGKYELYHARTSYKEKHLTKTVSVAQMDSASEYPPNGDFITLVYNGDSYQGFQMGNSTAYNFGDDNKVWFIESEEYNTVTEYRYRYLLG